MPHPYIKVADDLLRRIQRGDWKNGEQVPTVRALESLYPHSRMTLHKALRRLQEQGYLVTAPGSGTFVKTAHIKDSIAILAGGITSEHAHSPLSMACVDYARGYLARCGLDARVYTEDPMSSDRMPASLTDDLDHGRLKGLLTILSSFSFKHLGTDAWRRHRVPHVDIGSQPAPHRVYVDFDAFINRALTLAFAEGRRRPLLLAAGSGMPPEAWRGRFAGTGAEVYLPSPEQAHPLGPEERGFRIILELVRQRRAFDALIVPEDCIAKGIAQGALACGLEVPRQFLLAALVNRGLDVFYPVPVLRLEVDIERLAIMAGERLMRLLREPDLPPGTILIAPDREVRTTPIPSQQMEPANA